MEIAEIYALFKAYPRVGKDTRVDLKDHLYFALKGDNFDGNKYAKQALDKGAAYAIIDDPEYDTEERTICVPDTLKCLQQLATHHRQQLGLPIVALTGSNGKTTSKELIHSVLKRKFNCFATQGNYNNHIGVPLTLLAMSSETEIGIVEMGANHQGEIDFLCDIALPDYGYITNFGRVHLEGFGSLQGVIQGKTEMYRHLAKRGKQVFVNADDPVQMERSEGMQRLCFGRETKEFHGRLLSAEPMIVLDLMGTEVKSQLLGDYNVPNMMAAARIAKHFGVGMADIKAGLEAYVPENNRSQLIERENFKIVLDAYNANPNSMEAALRSLSRMKQNKKIAILGDMFEVGEDSPMEHEKVGRLAVELGLNAVFLVGKNFYQCDALGTLNGLVSFETFEDFERAFPDSKFFEDSVVLIKASRGMALERSLKLF